MLARQAIDGLLDDPVGQRRELFVIDEFRIASNLDRDRFRHALRVHDRGSERVEPFRGDDHRGQAALDELCGAVDTPRRACSSVGHSYNGGIRLSDDLIQ